MRNDSLLSVVIPTVDRPLKLARVLNAVIEGSHLPQEMIVVDQGPIQIPEEIAEAYDAHGVTLHHLKLAQRGVARARNLGIEASHGELIAFTDDDCLPAPDWLDVLVHACTDEVDAVCGRVLPLAIDDPTACPVSSRTGTVHRRFRGCVGHAPWDVGTGGNLLMRRAVVDRAGGFDLRLGPGTPGRASEDVDMLYRLLLRGYTIDFEPAAVVYHEMKPRREATRINLPYGYGMGQMLGLHIRNHDSGARSLALLRFRLEIRNLLDLLVRANPFDIAGSILAICGTVWGMADALRARPNAAQDQEAMLARRAERRAS